MSSDSSTEAPRLRSNPEINTMELSRSSIEYDCIPHVNMMHKRKEKDFNTNLLSLLLLLLFERLLVIIHAVFCQYQ
jgi:hypothetical protein